jgi:hypothetical protein
MHVLPHTPPPLLQSGAQATRPPWLRRLISLIKRAAFSQRTRVPARSRASTDIAPVAHISAALHLHARLLRLVSEWRLLITAMFL